MQRFNNILCVVTTSESSKAALERAVTLTENNQARLTAIAVAKPISIGMGMPDGGPISVDLQAAAISACKQSLKQSVAAFLPRVDITTKVLTGAQFVEIIREVLRNRYDLVIKACQSLDWLNHRFGSEDMHLLRKCPCPVWLVKPSAPKAYRRILAAVDVNEGYSEVERAPRRLLNRQIVDLASSMAIADFGELHIVHAWEAIGESEMRGSLMNTPEEKVRAYVEQVRQQREDNMKKLMEETTAESGQDALEYLKPTVHLIKGWERKVIPALAKEIEADIVVMGTVARTGVPGFFMGNSAESILGQLDCSILAIKPAGFVTPVKIPVA